MENYGALKLGLDENQSLLMKHHGYYREAIRDRFWYDDPQPVRFGALGPPQAEIDLAAMTLVVDKDQCNEHGYWLPHPDLRPHIVRQAANHVDRLKRLADGTAGNPGFAHFHSAFDASLAAYEINDTVRLGRDLYPGGALSIAKATYLDQIGTNMLADRPVEPPAERRRTSPLAGRTCRELDTLDNGRLKPLDDCIQANTIGVATVAVDRDNRIIARFRKANGTGSRPDLPQKRLGAMPEGWHCFSSGVLEWSDIAEAAAEASAEKFCAGLMEGMRREIWYETGFARDSDEYSIVPYAFARELKRPGKPQFFFLTKFHRMRAEDVCACVEESYRASRIREAGEYGAPEQTGLQKVARLLLRSWRPPPGFWIIEPKGRSGLDQAMLRRISDEGHEDQTLTYELYGALYLLRNQDISSFFGER